MRCQSVTAQSEHRARGGQCPQALRPAERRHWGSSRSRARRRVSSMWQSPAWTFTGGRPVPSSGIHVLNQDSTSLQLPRLFNSLLGCAIVVVAGYLLWPQSWEPSRSCGPSCHGDGCRRGRRFGEDVDASDRTRMRRRLYRDLSTVRSEFQRALTKPPPTDCWAAARRHWSSPSNASWTRPPPPASVSITVRRPRPRPRLGRCLRTGVSWRNNFGDPRALCPCPDTRPVVRKVFRSRCATRCGSQVP
jgi:hypothetical protein